MPDRTEEQRCLNCRKPSMPTAPFPICMSCAGDVMNCVRAALKLAPESWEPRLPPRPHVVYYIGLAGHIKIGTTSNLKQRMLAYPPLAQLLGVERGGYDMERERHEQFAKLRVRPMNGGQSEWFRDDPSLRAHIVALPRPTAA